MEKFDPLRVSFALSYPFARPVDDFVYFRGHAYPVTDARDDEPAGWQVRAGTRTVRLGALLEPHGVTACPLPEADATIAVGSNGSPLQLARKFADVPDIVIPCLKVETVGWTVRYARQIAYYGSIPASIDRAPGLTSRMFANFLCPRARAVIDETEAIGADYERIEIDRARIVCRDDEMTAEAYRSLPGCFDLGVAADGIESGLGRVGTQWQIQERVAALLGAEATVPEFVWQNIADDDLRARRMDALADLTGPAR